jgi:hypothetical protein
MPRGVLAQTEQRPNDISWHDGGRHPEVLLILDGVVLGRGNEPGVGQRLRELDPSSIQSVEFVAPTDAVRRFGPNAEQGALLIRTRPPALYPESDVD